MGGGGGWSWALRTFHYRIRWDMVFPYLPPGKLKKKKTISLQGRNCKPKGQALTKHDFYYF